MSFIVPPSLLLIILIKQSQLLQKFLWTPYKGLPLKSQWSKILPLSGGAAMLNSNHSSPLSFSSVLQHKPQRPKLSRHLELMKHLKHNMSKTEFLPRPLKPHPIHTLCPILDDNNSFLSVADAKRFGCP